MRAIRWLAGILAILGLSEAARAQTASSINGSFSGQGYQNVPLQTRNLATPMPQVPARGQKPGFFSRLLPSWLTPSNNKGPASPNRSLYNYRKNSNPALSLSPTTQP